MRSLALSLSVHQIHTHMHQQKPSALPLLVNEYTAWNWLDIVSHLQLAKCLKPSVQQYQNHSEESHEECSHHNQRQAAQPTLACYQQSLA